MTKKGWYLDPPLWKIQSPECSINKKTPKKIVLKFGVTKKSWCPDTPLLDLKFVMTKKSWCPEPHPPQKIQCPELLINTKILKNFWLQIWCDQKKNWCPDTPPPPTNSESRALRKWRKVQKNFDLYFGVTKKSWPRPPLWKIQSPEHSVNEKILKNFLPQN